MLPFMPIADAVLKCSSLHILMVDQSVFENLWPRYFYSDPFLEKFRFAAVNMPLFFTGAPSLDGPATVCWSEAKRQMIAGFQSYIQPRNVSKVAVYLQLERSDRVRYYAEVLDYLASDLPPTTALACDFEFCAVPDEWDDAPLAIRDIMDKIGELKQMRINDCFRRPPANNPTLLCRDVHQHQGAPNFTDEIYRCAVYTALLLAAIHHDVSVFDSFTSWLCMCAWLCAYMHAQWTRAFYTFHRLKRRWNFGPFIPLHYCAGAPVIVIITMFCIDVLNWYVCIWMAKCTYICFLCMWCTYVHTSCN